MAVPWTGFPLKSLIAMVQPLSSAKYVKLGSFLKPDDAPNQSPSYGPWPYTRGIDHGRGDQRAHLVGHRYLWASFAQTAWRAVEIGRPWKYGFKSIKSIVEIEFTAQQPKTFWNSIAPREYDSRLTLTPRLRTRAGRRRPNDSSTAANVARALLQWLWRMGRWTLWLTSVQGCAFKELETLNPEP